MVRRRDLVLLTNSYPYAGGDAPFVEGEIRGLSKRFDSIYVWTLEPPRSRRILPLPQNVKYAGSLLQVGKWGMVASLVSPTSALRYARLVVSELLDRGMRVNLARLLRTAAIAVVGGARLSSWLSGRTLGESDLVLYSFWGTDVGLCVIEADRYFDYVAIRVHGYDLYEERVGYLPFRRRLFAATDLILAVSRHGAHYLRERYSEECDLPAVQVARLGTPDLGLGPGAPTGVVRVVSCSSLIPLKRTDLIFDVVSRLAQDMPVDWVHFGDGPSREGLLVAMRDRPVTLTVQLRGAVPHSELLEYYRLTQISVFVNLSTHEGLPVSVMEALSFGIPVVATDAGGTGEVVGERFASGVLVPQEASAEEIASTVRRVVNESSRWRPREVWKERCDAQVNAAATAYFLAEGRSERRVRESCGPK